MNRGRGPTAREKLLAKLAGLEDATAVVRDLASSAALLRDAGRDEADNAKAWISEDIESRLDETGLSKSELARRLGTSRQHVGEIINEQANLTIETLAKLSAALDCRLVLRIIPKDRHAAVLDKAQFARLRKGEAAGEEQAKKPARKAPASKVAARKAPARKAAAPAKKIRTGATSR